MFHLFRPADRPADWPCRSLRALPGALRREGINESPVGAIIWPVDLPRVEAKSIEAIATTLEDYPEGKGRVIPCHLGRGGHPVGIGSGWWPAILEMPTDEPLHTLFRREQESVSRIELEDSTLLDRLNSPDEVVRLLGRPARIWRSER